MDTTRQPLDPPAGITLQQWIDQLAPIPGSAEGRTQRAEGSEPRAENQPCLPDDAQTLSINLSLSPSLAIELGMALYPPVVVAERHGLNRSQLDRLLAYPPFKAMVDQAREDWTSPRSDKTRIVRKSRVMLEECLASLYRLATDVTISPMARLETVRTIARIAGIGEPERALPGPGQGNGFSIIINLPGADPVTMTPIVPGSQPLTIEGQIDAEV